MSNQEHQNLVVKHNNLNSITYFDSTVQLKIFSKLIVEIRKNPNQKLHSLSIKDFLEDLNPGVDINKNHSYLKEVARNMFKVIDIPVEKGFDLRALFVNINVKDKSFIHFEINPSLKPYILKLTKNFTCYFLENIVALNSGFSIRIYELLKQYQELKSKEGWVNIAIDDLKLFLGISANKYKQYCHFKARVILTAQKELGEKTDIKFTFVEEKTKKRVDRLIFKIIPNERNADRQMSFDLSGADEMNKIKETSIEEPEQNDDIKDKLINFCKLSPASVDQILDKYTSEQLAANIKYIDSEHKRGIIKNISSYSVNAIKNDFRLGESEKKAEQKKDSKEIKTLRENLKKAFVHHPLDYDIYLNGNDIKQLEDGFSILVSKREEEFLKTKYNQILGKFKINLESKESKK